MVVEKMLFSVISVVIGVILLTGQAVTIHDQTDTRTNNTGGCSFINAGNTTTPPGALCNLTSTAKTIYNLYDFVWAAAGLLLIVFGAFGVATNIKSKLGGR